MKRVVSTVGFLTYLFAALAVVQLIKWVADQKAFGAFLALNVALAVLPLTAIFGLVAGIVWGWMTAAVIVAVGFAAVVLTMIGAGQWVRAESISRGR